MNMQGMNSFYPGNHVTLLRSEICPMYNHPDDFTFVFASFIFWTYQYYYFD